MSPRAQALVARQPRIGTWLRSLATLVGVLAAVLASIGVVTMASSAHAATAQATTLKQFVDTYKGQRVAAPDGSYLGECVSLVKRYLKDVHGITAGAWGDAGNYQKGRTGGDRLSDAGFTWSTNKSFQDGDILVWDFGQYGTGHIGVWYDGKVFEQYNVPAPGIPASLTTFANTKDGGYVGRWSKAVRTPDFNGNGKADIFHANGSKFQVDYEGNGGWVKLRDSAADAENLKLGDFDGDGRVDDVFHANGSRFDVDYNGNGGWVKLRDSAARAEHLMIGDFDGDGRSDDVFSATGTAFYIDYNGNGGWVKLRDSAARADNLMLVDFDGDGRDDDVFHANGARFDIDYNGNGGWVKLRDSAARAHHLLLGDFDSDGRLDDVFHANGARFDVDYNGNGGWVKLRDSTATACHLILSRPTNFARQC